MATTANFDKWLSQIDLTEDGHEDVYALYTAIKAGRGAGRFDCLPDPVNSGKLIKPYTGEDILLLVNANAEEAFLNLITGRYCGGLDMESWHSLRCALVKDD